MTELFTPSEIQITKSTTTITNINKTLGKKVGVNE